MIAKGQITVTNLDDGKTPFLHQAYKMKDGRFLKHYPVYEASPVNGYKEGDLWHRTDGSQPGYFVANKSNTTLNLNDWTFYANELAYSDTDKFYPKFEGTYSDYNEVASDDQTKYTWKIIKADDGIGIKSVKEYYAVSTSNITPPSLQSDWSEIPKATNTTNKYLWNYEVYTYSNGDAKETTKRVIGTHGTTGTTGNGITSVTNRYLATTLDKGVTTATSGWTIAVQATDSVKKYLWNYEEILYTNGSKIPTTPVIIGTHGEKGDKGSTGVGIKNIQEFYLASPLGEGVTRSTDGWTSDVQAIDSDKKYLWNYEQINYDNNTNYLTAPVIIGTFGSQGIGVKGITEYYLASPLSEGVRKDTNGWTTEMQPLTPENKYLWNKEIIHYTDDESALKDKTEVLSGTEIFTDKADDAVVHVDINGKSYQHAGSGKNLFNSFNSEEDFFSQSIFFSTGTASESSISVEFKNSEIIIPPATSSPRKFSRSYGFGGLKPNTTYVFSLKFNITSDVNRIYAFLGTSVYPHRANEEQRISFSFTTDSFGNNTINVSDKNNFQIMSDTSTSTSSALRNTVPLIISELQLEEGSVATAYEPPAPTPDYPIEIHSSNDFDVVSQKSEGGTIEGIQVGGRNLLVSGTLNRLSNQMTEKTTKKLKGYGTYYFNFGTSFSPNTEYTVSNSNILNDSTLYPNSILLTLYNTSGSSVRLTVGTMTSGSSITFKTPSTTSETDRLYFYVSSVATVNFEIDNLKLEKGNKVTDWTPAPEDITESDNHPLIDKINLSLSEPLRSVGDIKDRLFRDSDGLWKVERNVGERVASSGLLKYGGPNYVQGYNLTTFQISIPDRKMGFNTSISSHLLNLGKSTQWDAPKKVGYNDHQSYTNLYLYMPNEIMGLSFNEATVTANQKANQWISQNPITFLYVLATPTIEALDQELQDKLNNLRSFQDSNYLYAIVDKTNILPNYVSENLKPNLHATFKSKAWSGNNAGYPSVIGVYGDSAKMLYLSATAESMTFNADGVPNPSSQVITLTANLQNVSGNASFAATAYNGSTVVSDVVLSGVGNTRTFNQAQFPASANRVQVRATLGNLVDTVTIVKLSNGSKGQNAVVGVLTNESITLPANKDGLVPASSFTGAKGIFDVYDGITKKTDSNDVKYSVVSQSNITVSIDAKGAYAVTAMPTGTTILNGYATLRAVYNGVTIEKQLNVSKSLTGATGATGPQGATGATGSRGPTGATGTSVSSVTEYYLATTLSTGVTTSTSGWSTAIQTMTATNKYLWNYEKINFSNNTSQPTIPVIIGVYGDKGQTGSTGATGRSITSITEHYLATSASSGVTRSTSGWSTSMKPTTPTNKYLWNYETVNWSSGTTPTYVEPIIIGVHGDKGDKGDSGKDGIAGKDGVGVKTTAITYSQSTSGTTAPTSGWSTSVPTPLVKGQYLWTKTTWTYTDNSTEIGYTVSYNAKDGNTGKDGIAGKDGVGISNTTIQYVGSTSGTTKPTSGWSTTIPTVAEGSFLWTKTTWTYTDNSTEVGYSVAKMGAKGATGATGASGKDGIAGKDGKGIKSTVIAYATSTNGTTQPASGWGAAVPSLTKGQYLWTRTIWTYTDNTTETGYSVSYIAKDGNNGTDGIAGKDGVGISKTTITYAKSTNGTTAPTTGYTTTVPSTNPGDYLWTKTVWTYTDNTTETGYSVGKIGNTGATGATGPQGPQGATGPQGIQGPAGSNGQSQWVHIRYSANANGSSMTTTPSSTTKYVGIAVNSSSTAPAYTGFTWSKYVGENGSTGPQGIQGPKGTNGTTTYTWVRYADTPTSGMNQYPDGKKYIGLAFNKTTQTESSNYSDYKWSLMPQNIEIGGRNLLRDTNQEHAAGPSEYMSLPYDLAPIFEEHGLDQEYTMSFDLKSKDVSNYSTINIYPNPETIEPNRYRFPSQSFKVTTEYQRFSMTFKPTDGNKEKTTTYISVYGQYDTGNLPILRNIKLEKGNTATDWTEAPEDVEARLNEKADQEQVNNALEDINESLEDKIAREEFEKLEKIATEFAKSYEAFVSEGGQYVEDAAKLEERFTQIFLELGANTIDLQFLNTYFKAGEEGLLIGSEDSQIKMLLTNDRLSFQEGSGADTKEIAYFGGQSFTINSGAIVQDFQIGEHKFTNIGGGHTIVQWTTK